MGNRVLRRYSQLMGIAQKIKRFDLENALIVSNFESVFLACLILTYKLNVRNKKLPMSYH